ncbi:uncharacterized protein [Rutidosis leptorrhynchoides]|uniref:uncharacterized protein n=1 Tax=Rutidosis leptorrhynchoides TaxID=125765 RepID=UPI003A994A8D
MTPIRSYIIDEVVPDDSVEAQNLVRKVRFASIPRQPAEEIAPIMSPSPFDIWGIDILGPFLPGTGQKKWAVVSIDYFTKWVQQFDCAKFKDFLEKYEIEQRFTSVEHPFANGQVEVTNRSIFDGVKKKLLDLPKKEWFEELSKVLWAYRTTAKIVTSETPFKLAYGTDAVIPIDVPLCSYRIQHYDPTPNKEGILLNLDFIDEVREDAAARIAEQKILTAKFYNK